MATPAHRPDESHFVAGAVLGLIVTLLVTLTILLATGYLELPSLGSSAVPSVGSAVEPRPTPYWPFRDEWLTPRAGR